MKLRVYFRVIFVLLLAVSVVMALAEDVPPVLRYVMAAVALLSGVALLVFANKISRLTGSIENGMELLKEQDFSSRLTPVGQKDADAIVSLFNRIADQLKDERVRLREQNHFFDLLVSASPMGVIIFDFDGRITMVNKAAANFLGIVDGAAVQGRIMAVLGTPLSGELAQLPMGKTKTVRMGNSEIYRCSHLSFIDRGFAHPFMLVESITSEVVRAEKKAYEKVIRMIAHEVNNTVAGVTSALDSVNGMLRETEGTQDMQEVIQVCGDRCYSMSAFITRFADVVKIPKPVLAEVELNEYVRGSVRFMESACRDRDIKFHLALCHDSVVVNIDAVLFEQVLVNIIKNSAESIGTSGNIYVTTSASPACLEISDDGAGIDKEQEGKLFTPFFSTKPHGQGVGLMCIREILLGHGCDFSLRTDADGLTRFRILFPGRKQAGV